MRVPLFLHQFDSGYANAALGADDRALPISEIWGKTNDGLRWQATWDTHPAEITGIDAVIHAERDIYAPQRIDYKPWGVVHGRWPNEPRYAQREGALAARIARAAATTDDGQPAQPPVYIADLEPHYHAPFPAFWRDDLGAGPADVEAYLTAFTTAHTTGNETANTTAHTEGGPPELWPTVDARDPHLAPVAFRAWAAHPAVTRVIPQVYFTDFVRPRPPTEADVRAALDRALHTLAAHGWTTAATVIPALPGDATPDRTILAIEYASSLGCGGVAIWQRANLRADTADAISRLSDPWAAGPSDDPPREGGGGAAVEPTHPSLTARLREHLAHAREALNAMEGLIERTDMPG